MVFSSITFLFYFLPIVLICYFLVPKKLKNFVLLCSSLIFYFYGEPKYVALILISILITYIFGLLIEKYKDKKTSEFCLILALFFLLGFLIYFKYIDFLIENINVWFKLNADLLNVLLPIGISFYTFQEISYLVDVYRGQVESQKSLIKLATYVSLFPQLIAGPIVRYKDIAEQLDNRELSLEKFSLGTRRFILGLGKKVLIANVLGELINIFLLVDEKTIVFYWMYAIATMLQIYFDFSGYSDMAIGLGKIFGFEFPENFNYPYTATSITEFWRKWHITLGSWFRDYVYIPLGGNRVSALKHIRNIFVVWFLTGLWHGASWNFIIWGLYFAVILVIEKKFLMKILERLPKVIRIIYTDFLVMISFIIFSGNNILENIKGLCSASSFSSQESIYYLKSYLVVLFIGIIGSSSIMKKILKKEKIHKFVNLVEPVFLIFILFVCVRIYCRWLI